MRALQSESVRRAPGIITATMRWVGCSSLLTTTYAATTSSARASVVEVGSLTTVTVVALLYDTTLSAAGGCDPAGCTGEKTRVSSLIDCW